MANDSTTGGPLLPDASPAPLEGQALNRFLGAWVAGITGLTGSLIRPRWQPFPADPPAPAPGAGPTPGVVAWAAVGVTSRRKLGYPQVVLNPAAAGGEGEATLFQQEQLDLLCSFYDQGVSGDADAYAATLRDGAMLSQNTEALFLAGFGLIDVGDVTPLPTLLKDRWYYRADVPITLQRQIQRVYPIRTLISAGGTIDADFTTPPYTLPFNAA